MDNTENLPSTTSASQKRPMENAVEVTPPATMKRIVLGNLTNVAATKSGLSNAQKSKSQSKFNFVPKKKPKFNISPQKKSKFNSFTGKKVENGKVDSEVDDKGCTDGSSKYAEGPLIYKYLRLVEVDENRIPMPDYMEKVQKDITPAMREVLVDWLTEVADEYRLTADTLYLSVTYIDRFLSSRALSRTKLQLLGVSSMLVASKYEETTPPHVEDFCYMTDNSYTKQEVVDMENDILKILNYEIGNPTVKTFLRIFIKAAQDNFTFMALEFEHLASYIAELSLLDYICVRFLPSMIAASAIFLARITMMPELLPWTLALEKYTGYIPSELEMCVLAIHDIQTCRRCTSVQAVRDKYMQPKFGRVAKLSPPSEILPHCFGRHGRGSVVKAFQRRLMM